MDAIATTARVSTPFASRYLQQLCKHWSHNLAVEFTPRHGRVVFPKDARGADHPADGSATFDADDSALEIRIEGGAQDQVDALKDVVARHLERFAFRETPLTFDWR
jgi:hypothetical protein